MEGEENQKTERKLEPKVTYSVALVMAFLAGENENRQLEDLPQVRTNLITENFVH